MSELPTTRNSLLMRIRDSSDSDAWEEFTAIYRPAVCRFARRRGLHKPDADGIPFLTMPYLRGDSRQQRIDRQGPLPLEEILRIAIQIADGLDAAHSQGLVHRDVKPANILLNEGADRVRITDFGIARQGTDSRLTETGQVTGTPQYMSLEQVRGDVLDGRSDLFSLGSVIHAICTGRPPFQSDSGFRLLNLVVAANPPAIEDLNPAIPSWQSGKRGQINGIARSGW